MISPNMTYPQAVTKAANKVLDGEPAMPAKDAVPAQERSSFLCELFALNGCKLAAPAKPAEPAKEAKPGTREKLVMLKAKLATATDEADKKKVQEEIGKVQKVQDKAEADLKKMDGQTTSLMGLDKPFFLLKNPGLLSIPLGFLMVILGSLFTRDKRAEAMWDELYVRQNTGINAEAATAH
jgi:cation/acetate symporter